MANRQHIYISVVSATSVNDFKKALAYHYDKALGICIAKDETRQYPYAWTDVDTGCTFGKRFKTIKEAKEFKEKNKETFDTWMTKLVHLRRMSSSYHELKVCKQVFMNQWRVQDEL